MAKLVSLIGASPGTAHTTACLLLSQGVHITKCILVATMEQVANEAEHILRTCKCPNTGKPPLMHTEKIILPFSDVKNAEHLRILREKLAKILDTNTILDITGGRKTMAVAAAIEALNHGATLVASIIPDKLYDQLRKAKTPCQRTAPDKAWIIRIT